jgi:hypothetical protein
MLTRSGLFVIVGLKGSADYPQICHSALGHNVACALIVTRRNSFTKQCKYFPIGATFILVWCSAEWLDCKINSIMERALIS